MDPMASADVNVALLPDPKRLDEELFHARFDYLFNRRYLDKWSCERESLPEKELLTEFQAIHVEIGCGRARNLLRLAPLHPHVLFMGIERDNRRYQAAQKRADSLGARNLIILRRDIVPLVAFNFEPARVDQYDLFYPDPWPRYRHRRRRWYRHPVVLELLRTLRMEGRLRMTSDRLFYIQEAAWMLSVCLGCRLERLAEVPQHADRTHFEVKYLRQGRKLFELVVRRATALPANPAEISHILDHLHTKGLNPWERINR
jgi:tRNA (guanine-N(7)-)-methyltransferase